MCIREKFSAASIKFPQSIKTSGASGPTAPPVLMSGKIVDSKIIIFSIVNKVKHIWYFLLLLYQINVPGSATYCT
jgi:hypothetical protein